MDLEPPSTGNSQKLYELLSQTFPQFKFPEIRIEETPEDNGLISYNTQVKLLGQIFTSGPQSSKNAAVESVSELAFEVIQEFKHLILSETESTLNCEALTSLFRPLKEEAMKVASTPTQNALQSVTTIKNRLIEVENEKINLKVKTKSEKIMERMQGSVQMDLPEKVKSSKIEETNEPIRIKEHICVREPNQVSEPNHVREPSLVNNTIQEVDPIRQIENITKVPVAAPVPESGSVESIPLSPLAIEPKAKERRTNLGAPIPAFYEFVEKQSSKDPIMFDDFVKGQYFGCRLRWGKRFWVAPAEHRQKKDAHNLAAIMACIESFGEGFTFEGVDPRIYFRWTRESVRQSSDKYSFGLSDELLEQGSIKVSDPIDISKIKLEPLSDGRKFTSVLNEICQKMRFTAPNYQIASVNALTNYYVCIVRNFHDLPLIESSPFLKKNESKEDAAGKIYYLLEQRGIVDEASRIVGRQKSMEITRQSIPISNCTPPPPAASNTNMNMNTNHLPPPPPPTPPVNSNFNMMQMLPMFMMAQITQSQSSGFDPQMMQNMDAMMKQWQAFLAWQQQQQQGSNTNNTNISNSIHTSHSSNTNNTNISNSIHTSHSSNNNHNHLYSNSQPQPQSHHNNYSGSSSSSRQPPRQNDHYPNSQKRNYEESRRRYYD